MMVEDERVGLSLLLTVRLDIYNVYRKSFITRLRRSYISAGTAKFELVTGDVVVVTRLLGSRVLV